MAAIARKLALLAASIALSAAADTKADLSDLIASMTAALSDDNVAGFMNGIDKNTPGYERLQGYISGLIDEGEVTCNVEWLKNEGDDKKRSADLDWTMRVRARTQAASLVEHEQSVHVEMVKQKKRWRIVSISPIDYFDPTKFIPTK